MSSHGRGTMRGEAELARVRSAGQELKRKSSLLVSGVERSARAALARGAQHDIAMSRWG